MGGRTNLIKVLCLGAILLVLPPLLPKYFIHLAVYIMISSIAVFGLGILGASGQISLAQGAFYGVGAYTSALLCVRLGFSFWSSLIVVIILACIVGVLVGLPTIKVSGLYLVMTTLGINEIAYLLAMNYIALTGGPQGISGIPAPAVFGFAFDSLQRFYYLVVAFFCIFAFLSIRLLNSRLGLFFVAINNSEIASRMNGIHVVKVKLLAFIISAVCGGVAGSMYGSYISYIHPDNFKTDVSILFLTMAILGGRHSIIGMTAATATLIIATEYFRFIGDYRLIAYGLVLLLGMIYMPEGIGSKLKVISSMRKV
jgi:branched-chain amino acid transport system permease protein